MTIVLAIVGALLGAGAFGPFGFFVGALLGYLLGAFIELRREIRLLKEDVTLLFRSDTSIQPKKPSLPVSGKTSSLQTDNAPHKQEAAPVAAAVAISNEELERQALATPAPKTDSRSVPATVRPTVATKPVLQAKPVEQPAIIRYPSNYFSGENLLARVGVIVMFFGVAFLVKYAAEHTPLPIEFRFIGIALGAIGMLVASWRLRQRLQDYALVLQGGAIGILYLDVFAAKQLYQLLPAELTFAIMLAVMLFAAALAILQNARPLAVLSICGGFLAPILTHQDTGNHVMLFSYYALLNASIFGMAWFKAWRPLNLLGFVFTFVISTIWGITRYTAADFATTEPFLILFFLFYVGIAVLYAHRQAPELKSYVDGTLVFGAPIIAFGLQAGMTQQPSMLEQFEYGLSFSAVALSLFYLTLAKVLYARKRESLRLLVESFLALGVVFATLALPLALDGRWTSAAWALEGAGVVWMGLRQNRVLARAFGILLQFAAGISLLTDINYRPDALPVINSACLGGVLLSLSALFISWYRRRKTDVLRKFELPLDKLLFAWGLLWWLSSGLREIDHFVSHEYHYVSLLLFIGLSSFTFSALTNPLSWPLARIPAFGLLPALWLIAAMQWVSIAHPGANAAFFGWMVAFAVLYLNLHRHEDSLTDKHPAYGHMGALWLLALLLSKETAWNINELVQGQGTWPLIAWALIPSLTLVLMSQLGPRMQWPVRKHLQVYLVQAAMPVAAFIWLWSVYTNISSDGNPYPLSYLPLLNPLDIAQLFVFVAIAAWLLKLPELGFELVEKLPPENIYLIIGATLFLWLNAVLLRTLHYWADIPYTLPSMMNSFLAQASLSIFWSVLAMGIMHYATRKQLRPLWVAGGVLMGAVVLKLFTVDISGVGSLERIVSFIGVAILMLVIGYIAPLPAKIHEAEEHA